MKTKNTSPPPVKPKQILINFKNKNNEIQTQDKETFLLHCKSRRNSPIMFSSDYEDYIQEKHKSQFL